MLVLHFVREIVGLDYSLYMIPFSSSDWIFLVLVFCRYTTIRAAAWRYLYLQAVCDW